jgi:hypothetical protein
VPLIRFSDLPSDARLWVFGASRRLSDIEQAKLLSAVDAYLAQWKAHGMPLTTGRELREARFLLIGVDQHTAGASGCSIDALYRTLQQLEQALGTAIVAGGRVFWRGADGEVQGGTRDQFVVAATNGAMTRESVVFDTNVTTMAQLETVFERRVAESRHGELLP